MLGNLKQSKIAVVIPTLNEEAGIGLMLETLEEALRPWPSTFIVVDGRSSDNTKMIAENKGAIVIPQPKIGYGDALKAGFSYACDKLDADIVVMLDGDKTYDAFDVPAMIQPILDGKSDLVVGNRFKRMDKDAMHRVNRIGNKILSATAKWLLKINVSDTQCGLRAMNATHLRKTQIDSDGMPFATQMLARFKKNNARISEIPVAYHPRAGQSKMRRFRDGFEILHTIFNEVA